MVNIMSVRHVWDMECKKELGLHGRLLEYEQGLHGSHRIRVYTFPMIGHDRFFNIDYTLESGCTPGVSILNSECYELWLQFQSNNADEFSYIACVVRLNRCNLVLHIKEKRQTVVVRGCGVRAIIDISVYWYKCIFDISVHYCWYKWMLGCYMPRDPQQILDLEMVVVKFQAQSA